MTTSSALSITLESGAPEFVTLSFESSPPGPDVAFLPGFVNGCTPSCVLGIHLGFSGGAQVGTYSITITGTAGTVSHDTKFTLNVQLAVAE